MDIEQRKKEIIKKHGKWAASNIRLNENTYTISDQLASDEIKLRRILQIVADNASKPMKDLRVLDLACQEGWYAIELARHGAKAVGIEIREPTLERARFVKQALSLDNLEFYQDDIRNLSAEKYGKFDVVLCLGILYHLDAPDIFQFIEKIGEVCEGITIIDTHVSLSARKSYVYKNNKYWGKNYREHLPLTNLKQRAKALCASIDNPNSFWFTRRSLYNILSDVGFSSVYECFNPPEPDKPKDRITLLAKKGERQKLISTVPQANELLPKEWPEKRRII
jgi:2-polyprenyl-3-methyl-5-hydroxy-6-metoxy-1,4-benzoquinol methylase